MKYMYINSHCSYLKRFFAVLLALVCLISCSVSAASAAESGFTLSVTANRQTVSCGNTITLTITVKDIGVESGLLSLDVPVQFDETVFELVSVTPIYPSVWDLPEDFSYTAVKNGTLWLRILNNNEEDFGPDHGCTEDGAMGFRVMLRARMDAPLGESAVRTNGDGVFLVVSGAAADGDCTVIYGSGQSFGVTVTEFSGLMGDVNGSGRADNLDAATVLRCDAGLTSLDEAALALGDVSGDGKVTSLDAAIILQYDAGLIKGF